MPELKLSQREWLEHIVRPLKSATCKCGSRFKPIWVGTGYTDRCLDCQWGVKTLRDDEVEGFMMSLGKVF